MSLPPETRNTTAPQLAYNFLEGDRPHNQFILIGTPDWVNRVIARLHAAQIAEAGTWSKRQPTGNPNEVISVLHCQKR